MTGKATLGEEAVGGAPSEEVAKRSSRHIAYFVIKRALILKARE